MGIVKIGRVRLGHPTRIVGVVTGQKSLKKLKEIKKNGAEIIELRVDQLRSHKPEYIKAIIDNIKQTGIPVIGTIRHTEWRKKYGVHAEEKRLDCFSKIIFSVDAVDIEHESNKIRDRVISFAKKHNKTVIYSYHNFFKLPAPAVLDRICTRFRSSGADILKLAVTVNSLEDAFEFMIYVKKLSKLSHVIGIGMGEAGKFTRIYGGLFGSCITYAYIDRKVVPGQLPLRGLKKKIEGIYS